jgi:hypothetical protein
MAAVPSADAWAVAGVRQGRPVRGDRGKCRAWGSNKRRRGRCLKRHPWRHGAQFRVLLLITSRNADPPLDIDPKGTKAEHEISVGPIGALTRLLRPANIATDADQWASSGSRSRTAAAVSLRDRSPQASGRSSACAVPSCSGPQTTERAAAAMFYYGYLARGYASSMWQDQREYRQSNEAVRAATPNITVPQAFRETLRPPRAPG